MSTRSNQIMGRQNFVTNPETKRTIRVGGRPWLKLVKKGVLDKGDYLPPNCSSRLVEEEDTPLPVIEEENLEEEEVVEETGAYEQNSDPQNLKEARKNTSDAALDIIDRIQSGEIEIPTDMSRDEARDYLQELIFNQMLKKKKKFRTKGVNLSSTRGPEKFSALRPPVLKKKIISPVARFKRPVNKRMITRIHKKNTQPRMVKMRPPEKMYQEPEPEHDSDEYEYEYVEVDEDEPEQNFAAQNLEYEYYEE